MGTPPAGVRNFVSLALDEIVASHHVKESGIVFVARALIAAFVAVVICIGTMGVAIEGDVVFLVFFVFNVFRGFFGIVSSLGSCGG